MEHHSNLVPWQQLAREKEAKLRIIPLTDDHQLDLSNIDELINQSTKLLSIVHKSNSVGTLNPVKRLTAMAHSMGATVLVDGSQSTPHMPIDVMDIDCDFFAFSGHKMVGPAGIGVLYGKSEILESMDNIRKHEIALTSYALDAFKELEEIEVYGPQDPTIRGGIITFNSTEIHPHDMGTVLDRRGIAIRTGHHCTMPLVRSLGVPATARASFYLYNDKHDIDELVDGVKEALRYFRNDPQPS